VVDWRFEIWKSAGFGEGEFGVGANPPEKIPWNKDSKFVHLGIYSN
jgi:hypothetical protein